MPIEKHITFTYLNIRQSIAILLAKIVASDLVLAAVVIGAYFVILQGGEIVGLSITNAALFVTVFGIIGIIKISLSIYIVLQWLNEYYEITPEFIFHKKGIIFKKSEQYRLDHVRAMDVQDSFLGELLNYATVTLYDIRMNKYLDMYLIHNPKRYANVLQELRPHIEIKKDRVALPFMPKEEGIEGGDESY